MADHDHSYKLLFSHASLVRDLLQGFVLEPWVADLDFSTLENTARSFTSDDLRKREDDAIWRVRCRESWIYIYILIEFQSTVDRFMAVRLMNYISLLYQDLIRSKQLLANGQLPAVLPLVLYNGNRPWSSSLSLQSLIQEVPGGLSRYRPTLTYLLLDESRHPLGGVAPGNLVDLIFRLEQSKTPADVRKVVQELIGWLKAPEQTSLRRSFAVWIRRVLLPARLPGQAMPPVNDLLEVDTMLAERVKEWTREWEQKGIEKGERMGEQKGSATMLVHLLRMKFGELDEQTLSSVNSADAAQLLVWSERVLGATNLEQVFAVNQEVS